jgi:guanylate kinase
MKQQKDKIIVITAPSGAGKTTITKHLMKQFSNLAFSVSATTRTKRHNESEGKDYYFISKEDFESKIKEDAFLEWEMVYEGAYYGTLISEINKIWQQQQVPLLDIDVQGALRIKKLFPDNTIVIFIAPPSVEILKERLKGRGTESLEAIDKRFNKATDEMKYMHAFDTIILNDKLEIACGEAEAIIRLFLQDQPLKNLN